jgi:2-dehydro-3-deoxy-D-arabinonate dehydratase
MRLYKTTKGILLEKENGYFLVQEAWDILINRDNLFGYLAQIQNEHISPEVFEQFLKEKVLAPIGTQEIWAAGVTYLRSRDARMEESQEKGGADFYQKVYEAERPELFFKALPHRVAADGEQVYIRRDSAWNVPEPELTLYINSKGNVQGYTIGNDMSSRDIEGENPLYLPQAKVYDRSAAIGPCLYVPEEPIPAGTLISIVIQRAGREMFKDSISLNRMKRTLPELAHWLYLACEFPTGCYLMTGTGMVPPAGFTLHPGDIVDISIENIGTLSNSVAHR